MPDYLITKDDKLYRRVPKHNPNYWKEVDGQKIPSSFAFKTKRDENGLSVNIAALTTPDITAGNPQDFGVAEIGAATPIELGYECVYDRQPENEAHALILGDTNPIAKKLAKSITNIF